MTPCSQWNDELLACALGRPQTREFAAHLAACAECGGALEAWRARALEIDRVLICLAAPEPRVGGPERVLARIAETKRAPVRATTLSYLRLVAAVAALVVLACLIAVPTRPVQTISLSAWRSPTQSLLRSPAEPLLKSVPLLGNGLFEVHPGKEGYAQ